MLFGMSWIKFLVCSRASLIFKTDSIKIKRDLEVKVFFSIQIKNIRDLPNKCDDKNDKFRSMIIYLKFNSVFSMKSLLDVSKECTLMINIFICTRTYIKLRAP